MTRTRELSDLQYRRLLRLRTDLRRFLRWSADRAAAAGLTPAQHQLLLAVRGHEGPGEPTIGDLATYLLIQHHSAVSLVDRAVDAGLVVRAHDPVDHRVVHVRLTAEGARRLDSLTAEHVRELQQLARMLTEIGSGAP